MPESCMSHYIYLRVNMLMDHRPDSCTIRIPMTIQLDQDDSSALSVVLVDESTHTVCLTKF